MNPDFMARLRQVAATGVAPPRETPASGMQPIHEQLLASLAERTSEVTSPVLVPYEGVRTEGGTQPDRPGPQPVEQAAPNAWENASAFKRSRTKFDAPSRARKGTIEEVLGEPGGEVPISPVDGTPLGPIPDVPVPPAQDARGSDGEPPPREGKALQARCPICEGRGFLKFGRIERMCGRCGGEGYVEDPEARLTFHQRRKLHPTLVELEHGETLIAESKAEQRDLQKQIDKAPYRNAARKPNTTEDGQLACAFGEPWMGEHPLCKAAAAVVYAEDPVEAALAKEAEGEQRLPLEEQDDTHEPDDTRRVAASGARQQDPPRALGDREQSGERDRGDVEQLPPDPEGYVEGIVQLRMALGTEVTHILQSTRELGGLTRSTESLTAFGRAVDQLSQLLTPSLLEKLQAVLQSPRENPPAAG